jgi:steroid delta-isomerase
VSVTNPEALSFAEEWVANFNRRDVEAVLLHFAEEATFTSPRAVSFGGQATLGSRQELAVYWNAALQSTRSIHFTLDRVVNDPQARRLAILYIAGLDGRRLSAAEIYDFDESSRIIRGEAMYGAPVPE